MALDFDFFGESENTHYHKHQCPGIAYEIEVFEELAEVVGGGIGEGNIDYIAHGDAHHEGYTGFPATLEAITDDSEDGGANGDGHKEAHTETGQ